MSTRIKQLAMLMSVLMLVQLSFMAASASSMYSHDFHGFPEIDTAEFERLEAEYAEVEVPLLMQSTEVENHKVLHFNLAEDSVVYISASADSTEAVFVHPLVLQREDGRKFLLPLIRSAVADRMIESSIILGKFPAGHHHIALMQDASVRLPIPDSLQISASRPSQESELSIFINHSPVLIIKDEKNVLDDIPLVGYGNLYQRGNQYLLSSTIIFSSENGGTMPRLLMQSFQRTLDIEWATRQLFLKSDESVVEAGRLFQAKNHREERFCGDLLDGNQPVLTVESANNNFGDGQMHFGSWCVTNPFANDASELYYAPKMELLAPNEWSQQVIDAMPELQQWSQFELALENCVDHSTLGEVGTFPADLEWVMDHVTVTFPDRGCGDRRLTF